MTTEKLNLATGITTAEARVLQDKYGKNELTPQKRESFIKKAFHVICEIVGGFIFSLIVKSENKRKHN